MALKTVGGSGYGGAGLRDLPAALAQVQGLKQALVTGAAAATNIAIAGIAATSHIVGVQNLTDLLTVTEAPTITAGNIQFPTANTTAKRLLVTYYQ